MGELQRLLEGEMKAAYSGRWARTELIKAAVRLHGVELSDEQALLLGRKLRSLKDGTGVIDDARLPSTNIILTMADFESASRALANRVETETEARTVKFIEDASKAGAAALRASQRSEIRAFRRAGRRFQLRLAQEWHEGLRELESLYLAAMSFADSFCEAVQEAKRTRTRLKDFTRAKIPIFNALSRLHVRACRVTSEIIALIRSGHADGANARWRTSHEIAVVSMFINQSPPEIARRYLASSAIEHRAFARKYQEHCRALGYTRLPARHLRSIENRAQKVILKYGSHVDAGDYGWAAPEVAKRRPTFSDIEGHLDMAKWRPYYKLACESVHSGSRSLWFSLSNPVDDDVSIAGATNIGLCDPGRLAAISLMQSTNALLLMSPDVDRLVQCGVLLRQSRAVDDAFRAGEVRLRQRISK